MPDDALRLDQSEEPRLRGRGRRVMVVVASAVVLTVAGWLMTGAAPEPQATADGGGQRIPPLVMRDGTPDDAPLARAAALLAAGETTDAKRALTTLAVADPEAVEPQIGLVLARWPDVGPIGSVAALRQLQAEYPDDPWVQLQLGIAQLLAGRQDAAEESLRAARSAAAGSAETLDVARRADDLLHPSLLPGYPPPVVAPTHAIARADRAIIAQLGRAVTAGDRDAAAAIAATPAVARRSARDPLVGTAAAVALWNKDDPVEATALLARLHRESAGTREDAAVRLQLALFELWAGRATPARELLREVASSRRASPWREQAQVLLDRT